MENTNCQNSGLEIEIRATKRPRFKAGAELSGKVNRMSVDFKEVQTEEYDHFEVKLKLDIEQCEKPVTVAPCKK
jgi:hypothetical protein